MDMGKDAVRISEGAAHGAAAPSFVTMGDKGGQSNAHLLVFVNLTFKNTMLYLAGSKIDGASYYMSYVMNDLEEL